MSDVGVAPAPAGEVPINPSPVTTPQPLGPQTPDKPAGDTEGSSHRPESRREGIKRAFEKFDAERKIEPARPRIGHNQPPEETPKEKPKPKPAAIDLRKRPDDQAKAEREPQPRAEHGHFAGRQQQSQGEQQPQRQVKPLPPEAPFRDAPQRMDQRARIEWHETPESVRGAVHRMHQELGRAYQAYRADHEEMNRIRGFQQMAARDGTTLDRVLTNFTGMENLLRNDVVGGLDLIINNLNLRAPDGTPQGRKLNLMDVAWHIVNRTPEQHQLIQSQNRAMAQSHQLQQANERIAALENQQRQAHHRERFVYTRSAVDRFADAHPRFDELGPQIEQEVKLGFNLDQAYRRAELLRPATHAAQTRTNGNGTHAAQTRTATAQTRNADRSISGAPDGGGDAPPRRGAHERATSRSPRGAIAHAMRRVANGLN